MADFNSEWIEIFRVGDYGDKGRFAREDLAMMVGNFKAGLWKPPLVLGHPEHDSPAHGWVKDMRLTADGALEMQGEQVSPELENLVREGRFPNRSIALYLNPKGRGPAVRHVGFLGAMPPELKNLRPIGMRLVPVQFAELGEHVSISTARGSTMHFNETHGLKVNQESLALDARAERIAGDLRKFDPSLSAHEAYRRGLQKAREGNTPVELRFNETAGLKVDRESLRLNARAEEIAADLRLQDRTLSEFAAFKEGLRRARQEV